MLLHIRYVENRPFHDDDKDMLKELMELNLEIGYDFEYLVRVDYDHKDKCEEIMKRYKRGYFFT